MSTVWCVIAAGGSTRLQEYNCGANAVLAGMKCAEQAGWLVCRGLAAASSFPTSCLPQHCARSSTEIRRSTHLV